MIGLTAKLSEWPQEVEMQSGSVVVPKRAGSILFCFMVVAVLGNAQEVGDANPDQTIRIHLTKADLLAPTGVSGSSKHILPPKFGYGVRNTTFKRLGPPVSASGAFGADRDGTGVPKPGFYPADVNDTDQGPVVTNGENHPIYVNTTPGAVGHPGALLRDLGKSEMVHIVDQYVERTEDNRYKAGLGALLSYNAPGALQDSDIVTIVHAAAAAFGKTGYQVIYHVFLAPGQDVCSQNECYSPDNLSTFSFCAYHDSLDFTDIGHVIYSLEPFQAVAGCEEGPASPNGLVVDSTMSTLSHEFFETITDPDGTAWWNRNSLDLYGDEIADTCVLTVYDPVFTLNRTRYELQAEYSNKYHACTYVP